VQTLGRNRDFVLLQIGQALSTVGSESSAIAYPLLVLSLTHSPFRAGVVGFARIVPYSIFALLAGVAADRWNRKRLMIVADVVRALALGSLVAALAAGVLSYAQIVVVAFVEGAMFVTFNIAEVGTLGAVVPGPQLPEAAALEQARISVVQLGGPPLGGALFGLGRSLPFLADALSYAFSLGTILAMRTPFQEERDEAPAEGIRRQIAEGFAWLWQRPFLRTCAFLFAGSNFAFDGLLLTTIVAGRRQGLDSARIGLLVAAYGGLALLGSFVAARFARVLSMRAIVLIAFWLALGGAAFLFEPNVYVLVGGSVPLLFFNPTLNAVIIGYRVAVVPDRLRGRVNSVARLVALTGPPLGLLAAGALLGSFSARTTVAVFLAWLLVLAVLATFSPSIRKAPSLSELQPEPA
jgi:MFS family permease